ncbi:hypothetical protein LSH36_292g03037 [Paralvinella palmiformis]|uniref:Cytochrome P450 n=1 Tax=Paralvinella palmiformis TaxID=53620 RepID=A0AAD9JIZ0_9ANNE|nr:hypothetical protein LSH36_292g03037 [Paralvinella palmiformis]
MNEYVEKVQRRNRKTGQTVSNGVIFSGKTTCPFNTGILEESNSLFEILLRDSRVSQDLAVNLVMALLRTGIDSTGNALAFFLYNLANNPDKQQAVVDEIDDVIPTGTAVTPEHLQRMSYLKAALRESFRLHYPVFGGSGRVMPDDTVFSNYNVPKRVFIFANMAAMSRMEEYFPKPEEYHPERWLRDERAHLRTSWSHESGFLSLGFSHGLRACPGRRFAEQGLYLAVISILRKYRLEYHDDEIGMIHMPFTTPDRPLNIKFVSRNQ